MFNQIMNKSEVSENFNYLGSSASGWVCPRCGRILAPSVKECPCSLQKVQESADLKKNWIKD